MNVKQGLFCLILVAAVGVGVVAAQDAAPDPLLQQMGATAMLRDVDGNDVGVVTLSERGDGKVIILASVSGLTPGFHGFHIHETSTCDASGDTPFSSAGGHLNLTDADHPDHTGDLPSLLVNEDGTGELMVVTDRFVLSDLMDFDGTAIVLHSDDDNFANIPERYGTPDDESLSGGDSGSRVACGAINPDEDMTAG